MLSVDPLYAFERDAVRERIDACFDEVVGEVERNREQFVWRRFDSVETLARARRDAMERFVADYRRGDPRYLDASLPALPLGDGRFDLALCSHLLFLYADRLDAAFHVASLLELCRVAVEVRVFPLRDLGARRSPHLDAVRERLERAGKRVSIERVDYEFQKGGGEMLRVSS